MNHYVDFRGDRYRLKLYEAIQGMPFLIRNTSAKEYQYGFKDPSVINFCMDMLEDDDKRHIYWEKVDVQE